MLVLTNILKGVTLKQITNKQRTSFYEDHIKFLSSMVLKLAERSPLSYKIVSAVSALNPNFINSSKVSAEKKLKNYSKFFIKEIVSHLLWLIMQSNSSLTLLHVQKQS